MLRPAFLTAILSLAAIAPLPAQAQSGTPDSEGGRFKFSQSGDDLLRLDQKTGQVSTCSPRNLGWACHPVPDERQALEEEIDRLQRDNAALKKELLARGITPPGALGRNQGPEPKPDTGLKLPSDAEIDQAMAFVERVWKRFVDMVGRLQRDWSRNEKM